MNDLEHFIKDLDEIKDNQQQKNNLLYFYLKEIQNRINKIEKSEKNLERQKQTLIKEVESLLKCNRPILTSRSTRQVKYVVESLDDTHKDYKIFKNSLNVDNWCTNGLGPSRINLKVHRVIPTPTKNLKVTKNQKVTKNRKRPSDTKITSLLLLHGTNAENVNGILREDFIPSKKGKYGPGVYHTDSYKCASFYSKSYKLEDSSIKKLTYLFVNKVKLTEAPKTPRKFRGVEAYKQYEEKDPVLQMFNDRTAEVVTIDRNEKFITDSNKNKIMKGTFNMNSKDRNIVLAHHDLVIPAYLIEIEEEINVNKFIYDVLKIYFYFSNPY